jgi:hypothetical protein
MKKLFKKNLVAGIAVIGIVVVLVVAAGVVGVKYHEKPQFCAICHNMQPYLDSWDGVKTSSIDNSPLLANDHAKNNVICLDCHEAKINQQVSELITYATKDTSAPMTQRKFPDSFCLKCHGTRDEVAEKTKDYTITLNDVPENILDTFSKAGYQFTKTVSINPHTIPVASNAANPHEPGGTLPACNNCHSMHREQPDLNYCFSCHHTKTFAPCTICHSGSSGSGVGF